MMKTCFNYNLYYSSPVVNCGSISVPPNSLGGLSVVFSDTTFNSTATYSCPLLGFVLIGAAERECEADGNWTSSVPHCESNIL